jgi:hypothetical protein
MLYFKICHYIAPNAAAKTMQYTLFFDWGKKMMLEEKV